jgi:hypothetical protein
MDNDDFHAIPSNVSTIADLLDTKGISWGEYQEGLPYAGFQGFNYSNQKTFANDYVRKHNPLVLFQSVTENATRLELIKNFTGFNADLNGHTLPQWAFVRTPSFRTTNEFMLTLFSRLLLICLTTATTQASHSPRNGSAIGSPRSSTTHIL